MSEISDDIETLREQEQREAAAEAEHTQIWNCFEEFDYDKIGQIAVQNLKPALEHLGLTISESQAFRYISELDPENTGHVCFENFKFLIQNKHESEKPTSDADLLDAYVAMGGDEDGGGCVDATLLIHTIKGKFEMTIDIEALIREVDEDGSGEIEFDEFKELLAGVSLHDGEEGEEEEEGSDD